MAKKKEPPCIDDIIKNKWLVEYNRKPIDKFALHGFVLAQSDKLTLVQVFDLNSFTSNGYSVLRNKDIKSFRVCDSKDYFLSRFLSLKKMKIEPLPENSINNWKEVLAFFDRLFPLITIHREEIDNGACYIGKLGKIGTTKFSLNEIDSDAQWIGVYKYKYADITKIDAGGNYENALNFVSESDSNKKP